MTVVIVVTLAASALTTAFAVREYLTDRLSDQLIAASARIAPSLAALNGVTLDYRQLVGVLERQAMIIVVTSQGRAVAWAQIDEATAEDLVRAPVPAVEPEPVDSHPDLVAIRVDTTGMRLATRQEGDLLPIDSLVIALDSADDVASVRSIVTTNVVATVVAIIALIVLTNVIVGRGLRPLRAMSQRAAALTAGASSERLPVPPNDPDIGRLVATVNAAFDAQQQAEGRLRDFVADASHELRTPLTTASGWVELYLQGGLNDPAPRDHAMARVRSELERMRLLVDDLALLARLDRGRALESATVDLTPLVRDVVSDVAADDPERPITMDAPGAALVCGDRARLVQVVRNIVGNAVGHTSPGTAVHVGIEHDEGADAAPAWAVLVRDEGPGIPEAEQAHAFERFWRGDQSRSRNTGGSGLGLSIARAIVVAHGGSIELTSEPGSGTCVRVLLPSAAQD